METKIQRFTGRLAMLDSERRTWVPTYRELARNFAPMRGRYLQDAGEANKGDRSFGTLVNATPAFSLRTLQSGMMAGITSPARPWFRLATPDPDLMDFAPVKDWLFQVEVRMREVFARSNIYNALTVAYGELGCFGTQAMLLLEHPKDVIRGYPYTAGQYYLAAGADGTIDTFYRRFPMTVRQVVQFFAPGGPTSPEYRKISGATRGLYQTNKLDSWVEIIHVIEPNDERNVEYVDAKNMPFQSCYFEWGKGSEELLRESGFEENPVLSARWDIGPEDVYGTPPSRLVLGDAKALQLQERRKAQAIDKHVNPPMVGDTKLQNQRTSLLPGDVTYVDSNSQGPGFRPAYEIKPDIQALLMDIQACEDRIRQGLYTDLFLMLSQSDRREITAREIEERHEEKLLMLGPVLERLNDELLDPLIDRTFNIMLRKGMVPEPPEELQNTELKVEYISILAQAQKLVATRGIERLTTFVVQVAPVINEVLDKFNIDEAVDEYALALGTAPRLVRSADEVAELRDQRKGQQMAQMAANAAQPVQQAAQATKALAEAPTAQGSALDRMLGSA